MLLQLKVRQLWVSVAYEKTGEVEEIELAELIRDGHLAVGESLSPTALINMLG